MIVQRLKSPLCVSLLAGLSASAGTASAQTVVENTFDTDSYLFVGTNNGLGTELTIGVDLSGIDVYHFNFAVIEFDDLSALGPTGSKYLRFEIESFSTTELVNGFPVITPKEDGTSTLKVVALQASYSDYLSAASKPDWYDIHVGAMPAVAIGSFSGQGPFDIEVTDAVNDWIAGTAPHYGFALVLQAGDNIDIGASDGGNGALLSDTALLPMLLGDTDGDNDIDDSDLGTSFANYTGPIGAAGEKTSVDGDFDGDGDVDDSDLGSSFAAYTGPLAPATVPEPGVSCLLGLGGWALLRRRRV